MARIALLAITIAMLVLASVALQLQPPRHVDPAQLQWRPPASLDALNLYTSVLRLTSELDLEKALGNLSLIKEASIPENLRFVASRVNSLLEATIKSLNETKTSLDMAWGYFNKSSFKESWDWLGRADRSIREARISYLALKDAVGQVANLGIPVDRFLRELGNIEDAIVKLEEEVKALRSVLEKVDQVVETRVTVWVNTTKVNFGGWVEVRGRLLDVTGAPLEGRVVLVHVGSRVYKVVADGEGFFNVTSRVLEYRRYIDVYAEFTPAGDDRFRYAYSRSDTVTVEVFYITPRLEVTLSKHEVLPLDNVTLTVNTEPMACLRVESLLVNKTLCVGPEGVSNLDFTVNPELPEGVYDVRVSVIPQGLVGPASKSVQLRVYRLNLTLDVGAPELLIAGVGGEVIVDVNVDSKVRLCVEGLTCLEGRGSSLNFRVGVPLTYTRDIIKVSVVVEPLDPRFMSSSVALDVKVYNPLAVVTLIALVIVAITIPSIAVLRMLKPRGYPREAPLPEGVLGAPRRAEVPRGELQLLLEELSRLTGRLYGVSLRASDTFREYLSRLSMAPRGLVEVLREALMLLERALYGRPEGARGLLGRVVMLLRRVIEMLRGALS